MSAEARTGTYTAPELDDAFEQELQQMALEVSAPPLEEPREPGLGRYAKFQFKDFAMYRGSALLAMALVGLWIFHYNYDPNWIVDAHAAGRQLEMTEARFFRSIVTVAMAVLGGLGSLVATFGIVARDREGGHQKFLFAKPVKITRFYLQAFAINGVGLLLTTLIVLLMTSLAFLRPVPILVPMVTVATMYAAVGGLMFLLSTLVRFDLALALLLGLLSFPLRDAARRGKWWAVATAWLLPPLDKLEGLVDPTPHAGAPTAFSAVGSLVAYGAAYVAIGVAALKKRSIMR
jgi:hypothetical protein